MQICSWSLYYIVGHCIICTINMTVHNHFFFHSAVWEKWDPTLRHVQELRLGSILPYLVLNLQVFSQNKEVSEKSINNVQNYFILCRCSWIDAKRKQNVYLVHCHSVNLQAEWPDVTDLKGLLTGLRMGFQCLWFLIDPYINMRCSSSN